MLMTVYHVIITDELLEILVLHENIKMNLVALNVSHFLWCTRFLIQTQCGKANYILFTRFWLFIFCSICL